MQALHFALTAALALSQWTLQAIRRAAYARTANWRPGGGIATDWRRHQLSGPGGFLLQISPAAIRAGGEISIRGNVSSQFLTALLMAVPLTQADTRINVVGELISNLISKLHLT